MIHIKWNKSSSTRCGKGQILSYTYFHSLSKFGRMKWFSPLTSLREKSSAPKYRTNTDFSSRKTGKLRIFKLRLLESSSHNYRGYQVQVGQKNSVFNRRFIVKSRGFPMARYDTSWILVSVSSKVFPTQELFLYSILLCAALTANWCWVSYGQPCQPNFFQNVGYF